MYKEKTTLTPSKSPSCEIPLPPPVKVATAPVVLPLKSLLKTPSVVTPVVEKSSPPPLFAIVSTFALIAGIFLFKSRNSPQRNTVLI